MTDLARTYREIETRIARLDFAALWPGFHPLRFALYNKTECLLDGKPVPKTDAFFANTSIVYEGEPIAIWQLDEGKNDPDRLAASIVHEMFHAYQNEKGESRFPDETEALISYRYDAANLSAKRREATLLGAYLDGGDPAVFREALALRRARADRFPREHAYEARVEQIEGTATFVEERALSLLSPEKGAELRNKQREALNDPAQYAPIRLACYPSGALWLAALEKSGAAGFTDFSDRPFAEAMLDNMAASSLPLLPDPQMERAIRDRAAAIRATVEAALAKNDVALSGDYPLASLNIWDAGWDGRYATSRFFVAYRDGEDARVMNGDFVIELTPATRHIRTVYRQ